MPIRKRITVVPCLGALGTDFLSHLMGFITTTLKLLQDFVRIRPYTTRLCQSASGLRSFQASSQDSFGFARSGYAEPTVNCRRSGPYTAPEQLPNLTNLTILTPPKCWWVDVMRATASPFGYRSAGDGTASPLRTGWAVSQHSAHDRTRVTQIHSQRVTIWKNVCLLFWRRGVNPFEGAGSRQLLTGGIKIVCQVCLN
jgi:hypothetical protein